MYAVAAAAGIENADRLEEAQRLATVEERERIARDLHDDLGQLLGFLTAKIQAALKATDLKPDQLIMGYKGVKFDEKGQNILASGLVIQLQDGANYVPVWPKASAKTEPQMPYKAWQ